MVLLCLLLIQRRKRKNEERKEKKKERQKQKHNSRLLFALLFRFSVDVLESCEEDATSCALIEGCEDGRTDGQEAGEGGN